jgi:hypothetical protein
MLRLLDEFKIDKGKWYRLLNSWLLLLSYQVFSDDNMFVAIVQRMNSLKLTKPKWWRKLLLLKGKE